MSSNRKLEKSNNTHLPAALTCTQQCTDFIEERSHMSFVTSRTFPNFSDALPLFPLHVSRKSILSRHCIRLLSSFQQQKLGGSWHCCQAADPILIQTCLFSLYSPGHTSPNICLYPASRHCMSESCSVLLCFDSSPSSYLIFKRRNFLCCL